MQTKGGKIAYWAVTSRTKHGLFHEPNFGNRGKCFFLKTSQSLVCSWTLAQNREINGNWCSSHSHQISCILFLLDQAIPHISILNSSLSNCQKLKRHPAYSSSLKSVHISPLGKVLDLNIYLPSLTEMSNLSQELQESESYRKWSYSWLTEDPAHIAEETHQPALALAVAAAAPREQGKEKFVHHQTLLPGIWGWWKRKLNLNSLVFHFVSMFVIVLYFLTSRLDWNSEFVTEFLCGGMGGSSIISNTWTTTRKLIFSVCILSKPSKKMLISHESVFSIANIRVTWV